MRLTEKYMDPPGQAMPDSFLLRHASPTTWSFVLREQGKVQYADQFKGGFDWKTEEDAFMADGYRQIYEKGGQLVTYERLRAMGTNGFQELPQPTSRMQARPVELYGLFADGKFGTKDGKAKFMETQWRGLQAPAKKRNRRSGRSLSTTAAPTSSGRAPISTRKTNSSWTACRTRTSR